jgi:hypothetical protein
VVTLIGSSGDLARNLTISNSNNDTDWLIQNNKSNGVLALGAGNAERLRITSDGKLGLGTSAPAHKLTVSTGVDTDAGEITIGLGSVTAGATRQATITKNTTSPFSLTFAASNGGTPVDTIFKRDGTNESARIDGNGRLLVGTSTSTSVNAPVQIVAATTSLEHVAGSNFAGDGVYVFASRSRGSASSRTAVQNEDNLARYVFQGYSAAAGAFRSAAEISAGDTTDMPGRLVFSTTADGAASPTERMRITSDGTIRLLNSPGIDFSQIQTNAAGMTSETLDSYEEGTWGNAAVMVNRRYVKIGRLVHLTIEASIPSSGAAFSQTLPFAVATGTGGFAAIEVGSWFVRYNINPFPVYTPVQAAYLRVSGTGIFLGKSGAGSTITRAELETAIGGGVTVDSFFASISYYAAT